MEKYIYNYYSSKDNEFMRKHEESLRRDNSEQQLLDKSIEKSLKKQQQAQHNRT